MRSSLPGPFQLIVEYRNIKITGQDVLFCDAGDGVRIVREAQLAHSGDEGITQLRNDS